jgi:hypothetical protein
MILGKFAILNRRVIHAPTGEPYLIRWEILRTPWFSILYHTILRSDWDRALHDHPWNFTSIILSGGYYEHVLRSYLGPNFTVVTGGKPSEPIWYGRGRIVRHKATDLHRLELPLGCITRTLVFTGRRSREWGFQKSTGEWIKFDDYLSSHYHD